jgi:hypothetical protein
MSSRWLALALLVSVGGVLESSRPVLAQQAPVAFQPYELQRFYYYPYYYFPHNYWPITGPRWPERPNMPYMRPPAYMAYPPFMEPNWRYSHWQSQRYYTGSHFWLDQF